MGSEKYVPHDKLQIVKGVFSARVGQPACTLMVVQNTMAANKDFHQHLEDFWVDFEFRWFEQRAFRMRRRCYVVIYLTSAPSHFGSVAPKAAIPATPNRAISLLFLIAELRYSACVLPLKFLQ
ncbi:hypothetical protein P692DRAFT_20820025 [Suillus brevipes Sb2]|nr:hypothetical protein P692DRAFT_20820025 [Suillus brevipes Sb2]